jgi:hypothetical protein
MKHIGITESIVRERDKRDPDTISVYECGSVAFLESVCRLPGWILAGVPISGDKTATYPWRADR